MTRLQACSNDVNWVRAFILQYVIESWSIVGAHGGVLRTKIFFRLRRERARTYALLGEGAEAELALSQRMNIPRERLREFEQRLSLRDASLDGEPADGGGFRLVDSLKLDIQDQEEGLAELEQGRVVSKFLRHALDKLDRRERFVLESTILCDDDDVLSLAEVGRRLGVSRERTRQLCARALKKVRSQFVKNMEIRGYEHELMTA